MRIGIIGAGFIGRAVARMALRNGDEAMLSNARGPRTLMSTVASIRCQVGTTADAAAFGDVLLLAVPFYAVGEIDPAPLVGKIVLDAANDYPGRDEPVAALDAGEATTSEIVQRHLAGSTVVKCFNAILERDIEADSRPVGAPDRRALPICGDDTDAKLVVAGLLDRWGYDVVDAGSLREGWRFERATPAYCVRLDRIELEATLASAGEGRQAEGAWRT